MCLKRGAGCRCRAKHPREVVCSESVTVTLPGCRHQLVVACHKAADPRSLEPLCTATVQVRPRSPSSWHQCCLRAFQWSISSTYWWGHALFAAGLHLPPFLHG
jgi:hypothetical protein